MTGFTSRETTVLSAIIIEILAGASGRIAAAANSALLQIGKHLMVVSGRRLFLRESFGLPPLHNRCINA